MFKFVFWKNWRHQKFPFEINWPLVCDIWSEVHIVVKLFMISYSKVSHLHYRKNNWNLSYLGGVFSKKKCVDFVPGSPPSSSWPRVQFFLLHQKLKCIFSCLTNIVWRVVETCVGWCWPIHNMARKFIKLHLISY